MIKKYYLVLQGWVPIVRVHMKPLFVTKTQHWYYRRWEITYCVVYLYKRTDNTSAWVQQVNCCCNFSFACNPKTKLWPFNTLRPRQNGRRFTDDTFKRIFVNENVRISIKISLKFVPKGPINNYPTLVEIMAWRRSGDKPLSEPMMVSLLTHICVIRPQWVNIQQLPYMRLTVMWYQYGIDIITDTNMALAKWFNLLWYDL